MIKANNDQYFPALTGVRAIAAYMVFLHHYLPFTKEQIGVTAFDMVLNSIPIH
jgi:peptidoglycan/LPS O-acetylase OafA/YrhL